MLLENESIQITNMSIEDVSSYDSGIMHIILNAL